jgi:hypothetical protein
VLALRALQFLARGKFAAGKKNPAAGGVCNVSTSRPGQPLSANGPARANNPELK